MIKKEYATDIGKYTIGVDVARCIHEFGIQFNQTASGAVLSDSNIPPQCILTVQSVKYGTMWWSRYVQREEELHERRRVALAALEQSEQRLRASQPPNANRNKHERFDYSAYLLTVY